MWTQIADDQFRAVLEGYLVFLLPAPLSKKNRGAWQIHFVLPEDERQKAYLAGEGFSFGTSLEQAQVLALKKAQELRKKQRPKQPKP